MQLTSNRVLVKNIELPQCFNYQRCRIVRPLLTNALMVDMTMHVRVYPSIPVHMHMIYHTQIIDTQMAKIISTPWLLRIVNWQFHILPIIDNKGIRPRWDICTSTLNR
jgi:hypothetical protein